MNRKMRLAKGIVKSIGVCENFYSICIDDLEKRYNEKQLELIFGYYFISKKRHKKPIPYTELHKLLRNV